VGVVGMLVGVRGVLMSLRSVLLGRRVIARLVMARRVVVVLGGLVMAIMTLLTPKF
jgi:hypothetical protein